MDFKNLKNVPVGKKIKIKNNGYLPFGIYLKIVNPGKKKN